jgi:hypothetical protein
VPGTPALSLDAALSPSLPARGQAATSLQIEQL